MPRFFLDHIPQTGEVTMQGEDARHAGRVLRMQPGDAVTLCDGAGYDYTGEILHISSDAVRIRVDDKHPCAAEPSLRATLFMALPKADKMDFIVQKATELGVYQVVPFMAARCISRPDQKSLKKKQERWSKIAREAAKQCGRGYIPQILETLEFEAAVKQAAQAQTALVLYEAEAQTVFRHILQKSPLETTLSLMIGPEGGFEAEEIQTAAAHGLTSVSLGKRILRCETAPLAALAAVMYESGNL